MAAALHPQSPRRASRLRHQPGGPLRRTWIRRRRVAILTKTGITNSALKVTGSGNPASKLESHCTLLKLDRGRQIVIGCLYRPPRYTVAVLQDDFSDLETQLQQVLVDNPGAPLVICGDLNYEWFKDQ